MVWDVLKVSEEKPHRKANSCKRVQTDIAECIKKSPCFKSGAKFEDCISSQDKEWIGGEECAQLRHALNMCRTSLLNPNYRMTGNPYA
jgi:hypothetical protein